VNVALAAALHEMKWRPEAVKMAFLLGDAPPHVGDPDEKFTYVDYCHEAAERGIKTTTIGASGLDTQGEYIWRQIAQYTQGLFVFMTYGEKGDSGPDSPWTVSHHTGNNWVSRDLDAIIVQSIARELSHLTAQAVPEFEEYFEARPGKGIDSQAILADLNNECVRQLLNYSQVRLKVGELAAVLPPAAADGCSEKIASAAGEQLQIALARQNFFKLVERTDLKKLMDEKDLAMALDFDKVGKHAAAPASEATTPDAAPDRPLPANLLVLAKVRKSGETYDVYVKMVRVKTGQVVSASMMKINKKLVE